MEDACLELFATAWIDSKVMALPLWIDFEQSPVRHC